MTQFLFKRSGTADKRPDPLQMALGEVDLNYNATTGGLFYKDSVGTLIKVGPAQVGPDAPNATPVGSTGNALGEFWYDTVSGSLSIWDGTGWASTAPGIGLASPTIPGVVYGLTEDTSLNVALGKGAGSGITTGVSNVAIGPNVAVASATGDCQLAIGFSATANWLTGDSTKAIKPGAGVIDCTDSSGGSGQLLSSTGANKIAWVTPNYISPTALNASSAGSLIVNGCDVGGSTCFTSIIPGPTVAGQILTNAYNSGDPGFLSGQGYLNWCTPDYVSQSSFGPGALVVGCTPGNTGGIGTVGSLVAVNDPGVAVGYYQGVTVSTCTGSGAGALATVNVINGGYFPILDSVEITQAGIGYALANQVGFVICGTTVTTTANVCSLNQSTICKAGYLSVGANGEVLTADSTCALGVKWATTSGGTGIPCACITGQGALVTGTAASTPTALAVGTAGQVLTVDLACSTGLKWATPSSASAATPTVAGTVLGVTNATNVGLGCNALLSNTGTNNTAIGLNAGCAITTGTCNVAIGNGVQVAVATDSCQLALGFGAGAYWLTGDSTKAIKPGAGIIDCAASCGTAGQALFSDGANAVCWGDITAAIPLDCITSYNTTTDCGIYGGSMVVSNYSDGVRTAAILTPGPVGSVLCYNNAFNGTCWIVPNFLRGNAFAKGSIAVGCAQVGGGVGGLSVNGTGNNPGVAVGYYPDIPLTGGSGTGATANITVINGGYFPIFEGVSVVLQGSGYLVGEDLTVIINGTTLSYTVNVDSLALNTINNYTYLSVGTDGQVLTADSACTNGVKWAGGGGLTGTAPISVTTGSAPVVSVSASSTTATGVVQLYNDTDSTSTELALTAAQGKSLQDQITALVVTGSIDLAGTINANTGLVASVTSLGVIDGFEVGSVLPAASATTNNAYVIVTVAGTFTPPGGSPVVATQGDFILVTQNSPGVYAWTFLNVGFDAPYASTSIAGTICLSTNALALAGTDSLTAITPSIGSATYVFNSSYAAKGNILAATAANTPTALGVGTNGQALIADSTCAVGMKWGAVPDATPTVAGIVRGSVECGNTSIFDTWDFAAYGQGALAGRVFTGTNNLNTVAIGNFAAQNDANYSQSVIVGGAAAQNGASGSIIIGADAGQVNAANESIIIGQQAGQFRGGFRNLIIGNQTAKQNAPIGCCNTFIGNCGIGTNALIQAPNVEVNVALGHKAMCAAGVCNTLNTNANVALGACTLMNVTGSNNIAIGWGAACQVSCGVGNIAIGTDVQLPSATGNNQLAIGYATSRWLTGDSTYAIKPGAGIIDCANSCGTAGQVLMSDGSNAICWGTTAAGSSIPCSAFTAVGQLLSGTGTGTFTALSVGSNGLALVADSACATGVKWAAVTAAQATPAAAGTLFGCTTANNTGLGINALLSITTGTSNTALGVNAGCAITTGCCNTATGLNSQIKNTTGNANTASGHLSLACNTTGSCNTAFGFRALNDTTGADNTAVGAFAGCNITTGIANLALGCGAQVASPTGSCQLAIGFSATCNWLTGDSSKNIRPGAGVLDCTGSLGTATQVLVSTGSVIQWASLAGAIGNWTSAGTLQSVGLGAIGGTSPVIGTTTKNNVSYRQLGPKEWEAIYLLTKGTSTGFTNGSGDYLLTLPGSLQFDTTLPWQAANTDAVAATANLQPLAIPGSEARNVYVNNAAGSGLVGGVIPYDATKFRVIFTTFTSMDFWSSTFYNFNNATQPAMAITSRFQFTVL